MNTYRMLGDRVATPEARDLAVELQAWHDGMVMHLRALRTARQACGEDCPHSRARVLWPMALSAFGELASELALLRTHGAPAPGRTMGERALGLGP